MVKTRWEKKVKSKHKVQNRAKKMKQTYSGFYVKPRITKKWADVGCLCSCSMCSAKNSWERKSYLRKLRSMDRDREDYLDELVAEAQELDMGYGD